ncbi:hypothetical protein LCGC14_0882170 [marine sediment metagenome]|uniref:LamG-like jellyroll fold domain-containing protein n=1 Tax=marine sediment metagenome TaxID=412755 RepID=A0A0F9P1I6_9ZZZZ
MAAGKEITSTMSVRSFQGAEIYNINAEFSGSGRTTTIVRDTAVKVTGVASWRLNSNVFDYFSTGKTKAATDVIAACSMHFRLDGGPVGLVYRICTAGDNGGNAGRWYLGHEERQLKIYKSDGTVQATGTTLSNNTWYHILLIDDGTTAYVYLDGNTTADASWVHSQGAWNNKQWGPSSIQTVGKALLLSHWFDDVVCFDDQDGRMDWLTPSGWDGDTSWRVERGTPNADVATGFTPSTAGSHYVLVDEDAPDTSDYVWMPIGNSADHNAREDGTDYEIPIAGAKWGWTHDTTPAGNEWTDAIYDDLSHGFEDTTDSVKEMMGLLSTSDFTMGSEHIRAVRYLYHAETVVSEWRLYHWGDTVLIGPDDPAAPPAGQRRRGVLV